MPSEKRPSGMPAGSFVLEIALFGRPHVRVDGRERTVLSARTAWPILAELVDRAPAGVTRRALAQDFWPDDEPEDALANVRRHIHLLRTATALDGRPSPLVTSRDAVAWRTPPHGRVDVERFDRLAASDETLAEACALVTGEYLRGFDGERVEAVRRRLAGRFAAAAMRLSDLAWRDRDLAAAEDHVRRLLDFDPWHEGAVRTLMMLRFERGDRAGALHVYESFAARLREELDVEPMPETRAAFEHVARDAPTPHVAATVGGAAPPGDGLPFVGRAAEFGELRQAWTAALAGEGRLTFVAGEAGIGKSRLAREFARAAGVEGGTVLTGRTSDPEAAPYQPFVEALRSGLVLLRGVPLGPQHRAALAALVPELHARASNEFAARGADGRERERLFEAVFAAFAALANRRPVAIVLEDVHLCGSATAELLAFVARRAATARMLLVATYREGAIERRHRLRAVRRELLAEGRATSIALGPLAAGDVADLVRRTLPAAAREGGAAERIASDSDGNPFVAIELLRAHAAGAPPQPTGATAATIVERLIGARLAGLTPPAQRLARIAACIGDEFSLEVLGETAGFGERQTLDAVAELLDAHIVKESSAAYGSLRFTHHILTDCVLEPVSAADRRRWHLRIAGVMSDIYAARDDISESAIAAHFERGGDAAAAAAHYLAAARGALEVWADDEALAALAKAASLAGSAETRYEAIALREGIAFRRGDRAQSELELAHLERLAFDLADLHRILDVLERRARWSRNAKSLAGADAIATLETIAACAASPRADAVAKLAQAYLAFDAGRSRAALDLAAAAGRSAERASDGHLLVEALILRADGATALGNLDEALALIEESRARAPSGTDRSLMLRAARAASAVALTRQEYTTARGLAEQTLATCREIHDYAGEADALWRLGIACGRDGEVVKSRDCFDAAVALYERLEEPMGRAYAHINAANLEMRRGRFDLMEEHLAGVERAAPTADNGRLAAIVLNVRAGSALLRGDDRDAETIARQCVSLCVRLELRRYENPARSSLGVALSRLGRHDEALEELRRSLEGERQLGQSLAISDDLADNALAHLRAGDLPAAARFMSELEDRLRDPATFHGSEETVHRWAVAQVRRALGDAHGYERELRRAAGRAEAEAASMPDEATRTAFGRLPHIVEIRRALAGLRPRTSSDFPGTAIPRRDI